VYDLVTDSSFRSQSFGKEMMEYLHVYSKTAMCENIVLSSEFQREKAHVFYEKSGFIKKSL